MSTRIVYMGSPEFACPPLERLAAMPGVRVDLVVTQPDRVAGRGRKLVSPPVKAVADRLGISVYQTSSLKSADLRSPIVQIDPDLIVVAAFGVILGRSMLQLPRRGCVNLHASLLPQYRGAAPISAAILAGDATTGVSLMQMESGLDSGPVYATSEVDITSTNTTESLTAKLAVLAAALVEDQLAGIVDGGLSPVAQPGGATLTRPLVKADGWIDWSQSAEQIERHVRAMWAWPRAWTNLPNGDAFQIHRASVSADRLDEIQPPGTVTLIGNELGVVCGQGVLMIETGQLPGGKPAHGRQLANHKALSGTLQLGTGLRPDLPGPLVQAVSV